ncbi:B2 protein-like [Canna indica]|uniref:B2 protein-like n=1 Tax=Canna indica TaxID=4628 RepID=A0AAQ3JLY1_9LILI|nr:B2 protein-like [Canna indica]
MEGHSSSSRDDTSFWQFSDQLRLHTSTFSNLSLEDSIWSDSFVAKKPDAAERRNSIDASAAEFNPSAWKMTTTTTTYSNQKLAFGTFNNYSQVNRYNTDENSSKINSDDAALKTGNNYYSAAAAAANNNNNYNVNNYKYGGEIKNYFDKAVGKPANTIPGSGRKNNYNSNSNDIYMGKKKKNYSNTNNNSSSGGSNNNNDNAADKRFKTLPPAEALPRNEAIGGYIFVCNNETMPENLRRQLFGLPSRYRDSVRAIKPGLPLFLYNYSTHQLYGIFEAASFGGTNIDPTAWEDKKCPGESRFPAQVRVVTREIYNPLEEDAFRPILHHYDGPKFRLELNVEEALKLLDIFAENNA